LFVCLPACLPAFLLLSPVDVVVVVVRSLFNDETKVASKLLLLLLLLPLPQRSIYNEIILTVEYQTRN